MDPRPPEGKPKRERRFSGITTPHLQTFAPHDPLPSTLVKRDGQCIDCGFLSRRTLNGDVHRLPTEARTRAELLHTLGGEVSMPWCFVRAASLQTEFDDGMQAADAEVGDTPEPIKEELVLMRIILKDRHCPEWCEFTDPLTPAEHRQERDVQRLEEARAAREERLAVMEQESHESARKIQEDSLEIAKALQASTEATGRFTTKATYTAVIIAVIGLILVVATYLFPDLGAQIGQHIDRALNYPLGTAAPR